MCGRYTLTAVDPHLLAELFDLDVSDIPALAPRYNIAPGQLAPVVVRPNADEKAKLVWMRFGLIPSWWQAPDQRKPFVNARAETVMDKRSFRGPFRQRRCLVPANGLYEWMATPKGKQPYYAPGKALGPFAYAGIWERWERGDEVIESFAILTTDANELLAPIHPRMPVIVDRRDYALWLTTEPQKFAPLLDLLKPYPSEKLDCYPVSDLVNSPQNDLPDCLDPIELERESDDGGMKAFDFD